MRGPDAFHPRFESVIASPRKAEGAKEILPFDRFVERAAFEVLEALPFVEARERALPEEDAAGADGFVKLRGLKNPLAIDVTVSANPKEIKRKLDRTGEIYLSKIEREDALIRADVLTPIKLMPLFLEKKDFAVLYDMYAAAPAEGAWHMSPNVQRAVFHELVGAVRRLHDKLYAGNPAAAERRFRELLDDWLEVSGRARQ